MEARMYSNNAFEKTSVVRWTRRKLMNFLRYARRVPLRFIQDNRVNELDKWLDEALGRLAVPQMFKNTERQVAKIIFPHSSLVKKSLILTFLGHGVIDHITTETLWFRFELGGH